jgi:hypothetical protein
MTHPRQWYYPQLADYVRLANAFRPFVMFTHEPFYRSASVNTDRFGLREHYDARGQLVDLATVRVNYAACNVLVGGSTVFGVGARDDCHTLANALNQPEVPCLNFGVRGAVSHQELQVVLLLRRLLPPIENVILLSGVNLPSLASLGDSVIYPEFGGIFSEPWHYDAFCDQYRRRDYEQARAERRAALGCVDRWFQESLQGRRLAQRLASRQPMPAPPENRPGYTFAEKLALLESQRDADLDVWAALQTGWSLRVHFVLQPAVGWTTKKLAPIETACIEADFERLPTIRMYAHRGFYEPYRDRLAAACRARGINFHDANRWLDEAAIDDEEMFTDVCHPTARGYQWLAAMLRDRIEGLSRPEDQQARKAA